LFKPLTFWRPVAGLLWTAPELLCNPDNYPKGSKEGDVYSFGIVLHEIFYRMGPFSGHGHMTLKGRCIHLPWCSLY